MKFLAPLAYALICLGDSWCNPPFVNFDYGDWPFEKKRCILHMEDYFEPGVLWHINGDTTFDGEVGIDDLLLVIERWGTTYGDCDDADTDADGEVGILDLLEVISSWGRVSGGVCPE